MNWFRKKETDALRVPFPMERITSLSFIIPATAMSAIRLRTKSTLTWDIIAQSSFFNSYLCSYPRYLETHLDSRMGGPIRLGLLKTVVAASNVEAQYRFDSFERMLKRDDPETWDAFRLGEEDGSAYFKALVDSADADDRATNGLRLAIRDMDAFPPLTTGS